MFNGYGVGVALGEMNDTRWVRWQPGDIHHPTTTIEDDVSSSRDDVYCQGRRWVTDDSKRKWCNLYTPLPALRVGLTVGWPSTQRVWGGGGWVILRTATLRVLPLLPPRTAHPPPMLVLIHVPPTCDMVLSAVLAGCPYSPMCIAAVFTAISIWISTKY